MADIITNYATLQAAIIAWLDKTVNDTDLVDQIPIFIQNAQARMILELKDLGYQKIVDGTDATFIANINILSKPIDWKKTISFSYSLGGGALQMLSPAALEVCMTYSPGISGAPLFYADYDHQPNNISVGNFYLSPTPDFDYSYTLLYYATPQLLTPAGVTSTNWLLQTYPNLFLYACLLEATPFLENDERIPVFNDLYNRTLQAINNQSKESEVDRTVKRDFI